MFIIRQMKSEDLKAVLALAEVELGYLCDEEVGREQMQKILAKEDQKIFVAELKGQVVGFIQGEMYQVIFAPTYTNILGLAVDRRFHKQGIGSALLKKVESWGMENGAYAMRLTSAMKRREAHIFYEKCGYEVVKEQKCFHKLLKK